MLPNSMLMFAALLAAHLLSDFVLQSDRQAAGKRAPRVLIGHAAFVATLSYLLLGMWSNWRIAAIVLVSHAVIDAVKARLRAPGLAALAADQLAHLAVLVVLAAVYGPTSAPASPYGVATQYRAFVLLCGTIASVWVAGVVVGLFVRPFQQQLRDANDDAAGLSGAGATIGRLERMLIFVFILAGQPAAVGFLIAAKSILRFGEDRRAAEYIIIGTLLSFLLAAIIAYTTQAALTVRVG